MKQPRSVNNSLQHYQNWQYKNITEPAVQAWPVIGEPFRASNLDTPDYSDYGVPVESMNTAQKKFALQFIPQPALA